MKNNQTQLFELKRKIYWLSQAIQQTQLERFIN